MTKCCTVALENKPGSLAAVCNILGKEKINIESFCSEGGSEMGYVRFITNNPDQCAKVLTKAGYTCTTTETFEVTLNNTPGELAKICQKLADNNVNIENAFGTSSTNGQPGRIVFRVNNVQAAQRIFSTTGVPRATTPMR